MAGTRKYTRRYLIGRNLWILQTVVLKKSNRTWHLRRPSAWWILYGIVLYRSWCACRFWWSEAVHREDRYSVARISASWSNRRKRNVDCIYSVKEAVHLDYCWIDPFVTARMSNFLHCDRVTFSLTVKEHNYSIVKVEEYFGDGNMFVASIAHSTGHSRRMAFQKPEKALGTRLWEPCLATVFSMGQSFPCLATPSLLSDNIPLLEALACAIMWPFSVTSLCALALRCQRKTDISAHMGWDRPCDLQEGGTIHWACMEPRFGPRWRLTWTPIRHGVRTNLRSAQVTWRLSIVSRVSRHTSCHKSTGATVNGSGVPESVPKLSVCYEWRTGSSSPNEPGASQKVSPVRSCHGSFVGRGP